MSLRNTKKINELLTSLDVNSGWIDEHNFGLQHLALLLGPHDSHFCARLELLVTESITEASDGLYALRIGAIFCHDVGFGAVTPLHLEKTTCRVTDTLEKNWKRSSEFIKKIVNCLVNPGSVCIFNILAVDYWSINKKHKIQGQWFNQANVAMLILYYHDMICWAQESKRGDEKLSFKAKRTTPVATKT